MEGEGQSDNLLSSLLFILLVGRQRLMLVVVCCGCVVVLWLSYFIYPFVEKIPQPMVIFPPSLTQELMQNCSP